MFVKICTCVCVCVCHLKTYPSIRILGCVCLCVCVCLQVYSNVEHVVHITSYRIISCNILSRRSSHTHTASDQTLSNAHTQNIAASDDKKKRWCGQ